MRALVYLSLLLCCVTMAEPTNNPQPSPTPAPAPVVDFTNEDTYLDPWEGVRSEGFVRRVVLSNAVHASSKFQFQRMYLTHLMGLNAVYQTTNFAKYLTGIQGLAIGYAAKGGHGFEAGVELSSISMAFAGYRYFWTPEHFSLWPFFGGGAGSEVGLVALSEGPPEAQAYEGNKRMVFFNLGLMIPLVDVGLRAEVRANFFGFDRLVLTQGLGAVLFL